MSSRLSQTWWVTSGKLVACRLAVSERINKDYRAFSDQQFYDIDAASNAFIRHYMYYWMMLRKSIYKANWCLLLYSHL